MRNIGNKVIFGRQSVDHVSDIVEGDDSSIKLTLVTDGIHNSFRETLAGMTFS